MTGVVVYSACMFVGLGTYIFNFYESAAEPFADSVSAFLV